MQAQDRMQLYIGNLQHGMTTMFSSASALSKFQHNEHAYNHHNGQFLYFGHAE